MKFLLNLFFINFTSIKSIYDCTTLIVLKINLHSHTQFCDSRSSMEDILIEARKAGFKVWGFSPHAPIILDSPCNMKLEQVHDYLTEIKRLRNLFPDIQILAGMEIDFLDKENGPASYQVKKYGLDYVIGSVHFIPNQKGEFIDIDGSPERFQRFLNDYFGGDLIYVVKTFWQQTQKMIVAGGFDIIGHIDKIALNASYVDKGIEDTQVYRDLADITIEMAIKTGQAIEINTKHYNRYGRFFPNPKYWSKIISSGIEMPVNSDTHYAELVDAGRFEAEMLLDKIKKAL